MAEVDGAGAWCQQKENLSDKLGDITSNSLNMGKKSYKGLGSPGGMATIT